MSTLFNALLAGSLALLVVGQGLKKGFDVFIYSPVEAFIFLGLAIVLVPTLRGVVRTFLFPSVMRPRRTLIVGAGATGRLLERKLETHPEYGLELVGFVDDEPGADVLGSTAELTALVDSHNIDWIVLAFSEAPHEKTLELVREVRRPDVHLSIVPNFYELFASNAAIEDIEGVPVVSLPSMSFSRTVRALKRSFDIVASAAGLLAISPILIVSAIAIKLDSRGPVFFRQERHGRGGRTFRIVKFRTMVAGRRGQALRARPPEHDGGRRTAVQDRRRPAHHARGRLPAQVEHRRAAAAVERAARRDEPRRAAPVRDPRVRADHRLGQPAARDDPGITGLWQVLGRNDIPFEEMVKLDYVYVTNWSLWWDIKILVQTLPVVLNRRGAY